MSVDPAPSDSTQPGTGKTGAIHRIRRVAHHGLRIFTIAMIISTTLAVIGFFRFTDRVAELKPPEAGESVDAIVVLTGGYRRINQALALLEKGVGERLLISGVNPLITGAALRRATGSKSATFNCCVDIGYEAQDTIGNASETANWIGQRGYGRVLVVTNNYHIPRSLLELSQASPNVTFLAYPVTHADLKTDIWLSDPVALRTLLTEYAKYSLARLRNWSRANVITGPHTGENLHRPVTATLN